MNHPPEEKLKVLCPIDFSETSRRALAWAYDYATRAPCEIHLLHVVEDHLRDLLPEDGRERFENELFLAVKTAEAELERMVPDKNERDIIGPIHHHVARGRPASEILGVANKIGAELIVMGTHGRSGLSHFLIGSVAEKVVRHARCPVVCVKPIG